VAAGHVSSAEVWSGRRSVTVVRESVDCSADVVGPTHIDMENFGAVVDDSS